MSFKQKKLPQLSVPTVRLWYHNNILYCSGQIPLDAETMEIIDGGVEEQTRRVMENLNEVLLSAGTNFGKVLKCSIFLDNMDDFQNCE